jgi:NADPH2:quinone reductase
MKAIKVEQFGGAEALQLHEVEIPKPGNGEILVRLEYAGLNFIDVYHRTGLYPLQRPFTPGSEGAGVVESVGSEVTDLRKGDRVAFCMSPGAYAEYCIVPAWKAVKLPDHLSTRDAAAAMLQGLTTHYLARSTYPIQKGDSILIHAAAGGVGLLMVQVAKQIGAFVIGTVSTEEKARIARDAGADELILYTHQDFLQEVKRITDGRGLPVVYDSVGQSTFEKSLDCLRPRGMLVLFGQSSGPVPPFNPSILAAKGSLYLTRPSLAHYTLTREEILSRCDELFKWTASGAVKLRIDSEFPLENAAGAHRKLESRASSGKILLKINH